MTTATQISAMFNDNGTTFKAADGRTLDEHAREIGARVEHGTGSQQGNTRYAFPDGSAIIDCQGAAWDIEGSEPWSWEGAE